MNIHDRRTRLRITMKELAREAGTSACSVKRLETGNGNTYISTRRKIIEALTRLEANGIPAPTVGKVGVPRGKHGGAGRRRPDFVAARRMLGINQHELAREHKTGNQEISKIESGYAKHDPILESQVEAYLRAQLEVKGLPWPAVDVPTQFTGPVRKVKTFTGEELLRQPGTFVPGAAKRLAKAMFPDIDPPRTVSTTMQPCSHCHGYHDPGNDCQWAPTSSRRLQVNTRIEPGINPFCPACHNTRIVWNPATGQPHKCPLCAT